MCCLKKRSPACTDAWRRRTGIRSWRTSGLVSRGNILRVVVVVIVVVVVVVFIVVCIRLLLINALYNKSDGGKELGQYPVGLPGWGYAVKKNITVLGLYLIKALD